MLQGKIDTHLHFSPKLYVGAVGSDLLNAAMPNGVVPIWSEEAVIAMMDESGVVEGILSFSAGPEIPEAAVLLRRCNDHAAEIRSYKKRFGSFASLLLPDVDAAPKEVSDCLAELNVDGFVVFTNSSGKYL
jgi:hypothetical protein